jgi:hypothetical protein
VFSNILCAQLYHNPCAMATVQSSPSQSNEDAVFHSLSQASLLRFVSFAGPRLRTQEIESELPEIVPIAQQLRRKSLHRWILDMHQHNQACRRAIRMQLCPLVRKDKFLYSSLDQYMIQIRHDSLREVLDSFSAFAERLMPLIHNDKAARSWRITRQMLIHRHHWSELSRRVITFTEMIGAKMQAYSDEAGTDFHVDQRLEVSLRRLSRMYAPFSEPDMHNTRSMSGDAESDDLSAPTQVEKRQRTERFSVQIPRLS